MDLEEKAKMIGCSKTLLRKRLMEAKSVLGSNVKPLFSNNTFDFENKRLVSNAGNLALQWSLRRTPREDISYGNQQTSVGYVYLIII